MWNSTKKFFDGLWARAVILAGSYAIYEDLRNEITNPKPPHLLHDSIHFVLGVSLATTAVAVGGIVGGVGVVVGVIYGAWHLAKLLEFVP